MGYFNNEEAINNWHLQRWGRFTASENYKLMISGKSTIFGDGAMTYIETKALQMTTHMWEKPEMEGVKSLLHGKMYEYPAFKEYINVTGNRNITYLGDERPLFLDYEPLADECGGSPDAACISNDHKIDIGAEIKCPKDPMNHYRRLEWKDQFDIKDNYLQAYAQIQNLLMITGAFQWDFISYDERQLRFADKIKIIEVKPDKNFQNALHIRFKMAIAEKYKIISRRCNVNVTNRTEFQQQIRN